MSNYRYLLGTEELTSSQYRVLPINKEYPTEGFETLKNPEDLNASRNGWLSVDGYMQAAVTRLVFRNMNQLLILLINTIFILSVATTHKLI
jgi:hypothetical protein